MILTSKDKRLVYAFLKREEEDFANRRLGLGKKLLTHLETMLRTHTPVASLTLCSYTNLGLLDRVLTLIFSFQGSHLSLDLCPCRKFKRIRGV